MVLQVADREEEGHQLETQGEAQVGDHEEEEELVTLFNIGPKLTTQV